MFKERVWGLTIVVWGFERSRMFGFLTMVSTRRENVIQIHFMLNLCVSCLQLQLCGERTRLTFVVGDEVWTGRCGQQVVQKHTHQHCVAALVQVEPCHRLLHFASSPGRMSLVVAFASRVGMTPFCKHTFLDFPE